MVFLTSASDEVLINSLPLSGGPIGFLPSPFMPWHGVQSTLNISGASFAIAAVSPKRARVHIAICLLRNGFLKPFMDRLRRVRQSLRYYLFVTEIIIFYLPSPGSKNAYWFPPAPFILPSEELV